MTASGVNPASEGGRGRRSDVAVSPAASAHFEAILIFLAGALVLGVYLILWAASHDRLANETFTEWHIPAYAALLCLVLFVVFSADRAMRHGRRWRTAMPAGYDSVVLGVGLLAIYPIIDIVWTGTFGRDDGISGSFGLSRLLIPAGLVLICAGPLRAARRRSMDREAPRSSRSQLPAIAAAALMLASLTIPVLPLAPFAALAAASAPAPVDRAFDQASGIRTETLDGRSQVRLTVRNQGSEAVWSPDGERIAFVDGGDLAVMRSAGTGRRSLGSTPEQEGWITWSPDSTRIAYMSTLPRDTTATAPPLAAPAPGPGQAAAAAPSTGLDWDIFSRDIDGGSPTRLTESPGTDGGPSWSPDGRTLAFHSDRSGDFEIWVMPADGGDATQLTHDPGGDFGPSWSPDGSRVAFASDRGGGYEIYAMAADGSDVRQLTDAAGQSWSPGWAPDGRTLSFLNDGTGGSEVYVLDVATGSTRQATDDERYDTSISSEPWSADGSAIVLTSRLLTPDETAGLGDAFDVARILLAIAALTAVLLTAWHVGLWAVGTAFAVFALQAVLVGAVDDEFRFLPAILVAGLVVEVAARLLRPWAGSRRRVRLIAVIAPAAWIVGYFATLIVGDDLRWSVDLAAGIVVCSGAIGLLLVQLILTPSDVEPEVA